MSILNFLMRLRQLCCERLFLKLILGLFILRMTGSEILFHGVLSLRITGSETLKGRFILYGISIQNEAEYVNAIQKLFLRLKFDQPPVYTFEFAFHPLCWDLGYESNPYCRLNPQASHGKPVRLAKRDR